MQYSAFNLTEGLVEDPFGMVQEDLYLWKNPMETLWLWVNPNDQSLVYTQLYNSYFNTTLVSYVNGGVQDYGRSVSYYNFHIFECDH